jgi:drug/metabolite transporter (DMT)-like permease
MRRAIDTAAISIMTGLCFIWGLQQIAIKAIALSVSPLLQVALRSAIAAVIVLIVSRVFMREPWLRGVWKGAILVAVLFAAEFYFVAEGLRYTSAAHMAVFLYTAPIFAAFGLHLAIKHERLTSVQWSGVVIAFLGITVTFLGPTLATAASMANQAGMLGDFFGLCAGAAWGFTTVTVRASRLSDAPAIQTLFYQLAGGGLFLLPLAAFTGQNTFQPTMFAIGSVAFQTIVVSVVSYLTWFWMLKHYLASRLGILSFMTPMFGVALGALLLNEHIGGWFAVGSMITLVGMLVVNAHGLLRTMGRLRRNIEPTQPSQ